MKELVAQIKEQIAAFTENADLQVEKNTRLPEPVPVRPRWS